MDCFQVLMMDHVVNVMGPEVSTTDSGGGVDESWPTPRQLAVSCLINAPVDSLQQRFDADNLIGNVVVATFYGGVQRGDQIVVVKGPPFVGAKMKVVGIKSQPGIELLGFPDQSPIWHLHCEHLRVVV